jgi:ubiquitin carboxyl-terminal hydrolase 8
MNTEKDCRGLSGLGNLGNTCYMNATLQCLFATDLFNYYLKSHKFKKDLKEGIIVIEFKNNKSILKLNPHITEEELKEYIKSKKPYLKDKFKNSLTYSIYQLFNLMWSENCGVKPKKLKEVIAHFCPKFSGYSQHDSEELLYGLFDRLNDEIKTDIKITRFMVSNEVADYYDRKKQLLKTINEAQEDEKESYINILNKFIADNYNLDIIIKSKEFWKSYLKQNHSIISTIFTGLYCSRIKCNNCNNCNINFEPFNIIELSLTDKSGNIFSTIDECLEYFSNGETVDYKCDSCKTNTTATKQMTLFDIPPKLIIQLKRFSSSPTGIRTFGLNGGKINNLIKFPLDDLNLKKNTNEIKPLKTKYNLYATVNHYGSLGGGHYVANCKNLLDHKWYHFNDDTISYVNDDNDIIDSSAYILFYETN